MLFLLFIASLNTLQTEHLLSCSMLHGRDTQLYYCRTCLTCNRMLYNYVYVQFVVF